MDLCWDPWVYDRDYMRNEFWNHCRMYMCVLHYFRWDVAYYRGQIDGIAHVMDEYEIKLSWVSISVNSENSKFCLTTLNAVQLSRFEFIFQIHWSTVNTTINKVYENLSYFCSLLLNIAYMECFRPPVHPQK